MRKKQEEYTGPSGVLLVDKAPDMTSHDVVAIARRALNTKKIGHCGTLDPMATGLLMLVIGRATKIQDLLMSEDKVYEGTFCQVKSDNQIHPIIVFECHDD
jgi:tRNA pseudouridine55 synthase